MTNSLNSDQAVARCRSEAKSGKKTVFIDEDYEQNKTNY